MRRSGVDYFLGVKPSIVKKFKAVAVLVVERGGKREICQQERYEQNGV